MKITAAGRTMMTGAGIALTAGMLMGGAMRPDFGADDRPAGPQMFATATPRSTGPFDDDGVAATPYPGKLPDYVIGTDWSRPAQATPPPQEVRDEPETEVSYYQRPDLDIPEPPAATPRDLTPASYAETAPEPAADTPQIESEAPPEATGDTTPDR